MTKKKTSVVWHPSTDELQKILDESDSFTEVCKKLGLNAHSGSIRTLYRRVVEDKLDTTKLRNNLSKRRKFTGFQKTLIETAIFTENSTTTRKTVRKHILRFNIIKYECKKCLNSGEWMGEPLSLQLEHINGINNDNRLANLCWLCPNCHSQTGTFAGRNIKKTIKTRINRKRKFDPTKEELADLLMQMSFVKIGGKFGVSDNAVRKRCRLYGLI